MSFGSSAARLIIPPLKTTFFLMQEPQPHSRLSAKHNKPENPGQPTRNTLKSVKTKNPLFSENSAHSALFPDLPDFDTYRVI